MVEPIHRLEMLGAKQRHVREADERVHGGWRCLGGEHVLISNACPWFLSQWRPQKTEEAFEHAAGHTAQPGIVFIAGLGKRGTSRLTQNQPSAANEILVIALAGQLVEKSGIVVFGEEAKEDPTCVH